MPKKFNITELSGKKYGRLTIIGYCAEKTNTGRRVTMAKCDCGIEKGYQLSSIISGKTQSCGCLSDEVRGKSSITHGLSKHTLYNVWKKMNERCTNKKCHEYKYYGGRGVKVSTRWQKDFQAFYDWAIKRWQPGLELDKDKLASQQTGVLYCPELCCFLPSKENTRNRSSNRMVKYKGETKCLTEWCDLLNINYSTTIRRIKLGWSTEKAFTQPIREIKK